MGAWIETTMILFYVHGPYGRTLTWVRGLKQSMLSRIFMDTMKVAPLHGCVD